MKRCVIRATLFVASLLGAGACGGSSSDGTGNSGPVSETGFPARFADTVCQAMGPCCADNGFTYDYETCRSSLDAQLRSLITAREGMQVAFDDASAGACIDAYASALRACEPMDADPCERLFVGLVPLGGTCSENIECAEEAGMVVTCTNGICETESGARSDVRRTEGESCAMTCREDGSSSACSGSGTATGTGTCYVNDGLYCDAAAGSVCAPVAAEGEPCSENGWCAEGAFCDGGTCVAQRETGPCPRFDACAPTSYCDADTQACLPRHAPGEPCDNYDQCLDGSCQDGVCRERVPVDAGTCVGLLD